MNVTQMLADLRSEKEQVEQMILMLERLALGHGMRGPRRPPKWLTAVKKRGRPKGSKNKPKDAA